MKYTILAPCNSRSSGGVSEVVRQLGAAIYDICKESLSVLSYCDKFSKEDLPLYGNVPMILYNRSNLPLMRSLGYSNDLFSRLKDIHPDIIDTQGLWMYFSAATLKYKKRYGAKVVVTPHGMLDPWAVKNSAWKKKIVGRLFEYENLRSADCIKALCRSEYESIREFGLKNPVAIIPNGINLPKNVQYDRRHEKKILLFVGRIHPKKGIRELLEGLSMVKCSNPELLAKWQVRIAGWDQNGHTEDLVAFTKEKGLENSVEFIGSVFGRDKEYELCKANAFVLNSFSEGLPMSILEAWSYDLPVIMTDQCNLPEGFQYDAAIRVETTPESIAKGLINLFEMEDEQLERIGHNGRSLVMNKFTWDIIAKQTIELYHWLLLGGHTPDFVIND